LLKKKKNSKETIDQKTIKSHSEEKEKNNINLIEKEELIMS
jgi:hypothetical protein